MALQGDFAAHCRAIRAAGAQPYEVRTAGELNATDALILPGGESTTMLKLLDIENLFGPLQQFGRHKPIFGTCAGAILLATEVLNPAQRSLGLVDMTVERNAYGRQIDSRVASIQLNGHTTEAVFIRAPVIRRTGPDATVLATYLDTPVLVEDARHLIATFHPELSHQHVGAIHTYFVNKVAALQ